VALRSDDVDAADEVGDELDDDDKGDREGSNTTARVNASRPPTKWHAGKRQRVQRLQQPTKRNRSKPASRVTGKGKRRTLTSSV